MQKDLDYFTIENQYGGSQAWFRDRFMRMGGCAAASACDVCIYLALRFGKTALYPYDLSALCREDYVRFAMKMKPYLRPRMRGIDKTAIFIDGFRNYLDDAGDHSLSMRGVSGAEPVETALTGIRAQLDAGLPVPYLLLRHTNSDMDAFEWHWFLLTGYYEKPDDLLVRTATYGYSRFFSLRALWDTGYSEKGGFVALSLLPPAPVNTVSAQPVPPLRYD